MLLRLALLSAVLAMLFSGFSVCAAEEKEDAQATVSTGNLPYVVNLKPFYRNRFGARGGFRNFAPSQTIDGLPFKIQGQVALPGRNDRERDRNAPRNVSGIRIGRAFDELHLIHDVVWEDPVGTTVAIVRLHYSDGKHFDLPLQYGVHVMDWNRLLSEETETLDGDSKIIHRYPGVNKGTGRLFKSILYNPFPKKKVDTMELIATEAFSTYQLAAVTVAKTDPQRPVTKGLILNDPPRHFDGEIKIKLVDDKGQPLANAEISGFTMLSGEGIVIPPLRTDTDGEAVLKYPTEGTSSIGFKAEKKGYKILTPEWQGWRAGSIPKEATCRFEKVPEPLIPMPSGKTIMLIVLGFCIFIAIFMAITLCNLFSKAKRPAWAGLVPFYNGYVLLELSNRPGWWLIPMCIPVVNIILGLFVAIGLARNFGKSWGFAIGLVLCPLVFLPILGLGKARYQPVMVDSAISKETGEVPTYPESAN